MREQKWTVVGKPRFADVKFEDNEPWKFTAFFEVLPEFDLKEYKGLEVGEEEQPVIEAEVDEAFERLREEAAVFEPVTGRPAAEGDFVSVSYTGREENAPRSRPIEVKDAMIHLGDPNTEKAFARNLVGSNPGEVREFSADYPRDFVKGELAGKTFRYRAQVHAIKQKALPALDDEFAKTVSDFSTLAELRERVRQDVVRAHERETRYRTERRLLERLAERHAFAVPESLVEERSHQKIERFRRNLADRGVNPDASEINWPEARGTLRAEAEQEVRSALILEKVADAEKLEVSEEELDDSLRDLAADGRETAAELKTRLTREGRLDKLRSSRRNQKALDFIYQHARIVRQLSLV